MTRELVVERVFDAPLDVVWRCLTEAQHLARWWVPAPVRIEAMVIEARPGGRFGYVMVMEDGAQVPMEMMILQAADHRLLFTDLMTAGFQPVEAPFFGFVGELAVTAVPGGLGGTTYRATARHARAADAARHAEMGFHDGWGAVADQLGIYAKGLL
ncbi:SRPBCC domain-containing protein [Rhodobacter sp. KR11]|uniref:SRPBCC domain-containing protein n=1 Tax=Rhodobacter sp. KR11 TaxID=2974588 RepID=UPI0022223AC7|nr:SRPBCC domain-containing protein [Rhodobacter sp. KR11]MCW1920159.1 SRPBCC domain-containing protein [Rhodobacter sp. KR11]